MSQNKKTEWVFPPKFFLPTGSDGPYPTREITYWIGPFTNLASRAEAIATVNDLTGQVSDLMKQPWHGNVLLPTNYGPWPQSECSQTLPADLLVATPDDVAAIRADFEGNGIGFGHWFVPLNCSELNPDAPNSGWQYDDSRAPGVQIPELCAAFARVSGFSAANFEPGRQFWGPGDNAVAINAFWSRFWNALSADDQQALNGNTCATLVPNDWGLSSFGGTLGALAGGGEMLHAGQTLVNLAGGVTALALECYGGPNTQGDYPYPELWPSPSMALVRGAASAPHVDWAPADTLVPILAIENLTAQIRQAARLSCGVVQVWSI